METLYDLLGALPRDDAEELRAAFRKAVKGSHPDLRPGDPDAGMKFREIVRANEILADGAQRAAYDHLLDLARIEQEQSIRQARRVHRLTAMALALAGVSATAIGGLALFAHLTAHAGLATNTDVATPTVMAVVVTEEPATPPPASPAETADNAAPPLGPPIDITPAPGILDRMYGFDRTYADISRAKRPAKKKPTTATSHATSSRRTADIDPAQEGAASFMRRP
jgi:curved DNA-binding protein CbpA